LEGLLRVLGNSATKGLDTLELAVYHDGFGGDYDPNIDNLTEIVSLLHFLPNLRILMLDSFHDSGVAMTSGSLLLNAVKGLKWLKQLSLLFYPFKTMLNVSHLTSNMPYLLSLDISHSVAPIDPGDAPDRDVVISSLQNMSIFAFNDVFSDYMKDWTLPSLRRLNILFGFGSNDRGLAAMLQSSSIASTLQTLDLFGWEDVQITINVSTVLELLPSLEELAFVIEWNIQGPIAHKRLNRIGIYGGGILFAFRRDTMPPPPRWLSPKRYTAHNVVLTISKLNKINFPQLTTVRLLSLDEVHYFLARGGTDALDEEKSATWLEWREQTTRDGIRVEDCTGNEFGTWPDIPGSDAAFSILEP